MTDRKGVEQERPKMQFWKEKRSRRKYRVWESGSRLGNSVGKRVIMKSGLECFFQKLGCWEGGLVLW